MVSWRKRDFQDFSREVEAHIDLETDRLAADGLSREEARIAAIRKFGNRTSAKERFYEAGRIVWVDALLWDLRYAIRTLAKTPGYTAVALLTMALMIGGVSTVFTLVHAVLLRPLPFPDSDSLVRIEETNPGIDFADAVSEGMFQAIEDQSTSFDIVAGYANGAVYTLDPATEPYQVRINSITRDFFRLFGIQPTLGRPFQEEDEAVPSQEFGTVSADG